MEMDIDDKETFPLYQRYQLQSQAQPAFMELDLDGRVTFRYNPEVGNAVPVDVYHRRTLRWDVHNCMTVDEIKTVFDDVLPLLERIHAGHDVKWDGSNLVGVFSDDAHSAMVDLEDALWGWTETIEEVGTYSLTPEYWDDE